jgi:hypothetical protein
VEKEGFNATKAQLKHTTPFSGLTPTGGIAAQTKRKNTHAD